MTKAADVNSTLMGLKQALQALLQGTPTCVFLHTHTGLAAMQLWDLHHLYSPQTSHCNIVRLTHDVQHEQVSIIACDIQYRQ